MFTEKEKKDRATSQAKVELSKVNAAILLAENNDLGCEIHIAGIVVGVCNNKKILPALRYDKLQIEKYLNGEVNEWE